MSEKEGIEQKPDSTTEERENNGADMSDAREMNEEMKKEYEEGDGEGQLQKAEKLNEKERKRTEGSKMNEEEI